MCARCSIILQTVRYRLVFCRDDPIVQCALVISVHDLTRLCDEVAGIMLESHVNRLHVSQNGCIIFDDSLVGYVFLEKLALHFQVQKPYVK